MCESCTGQAKSDVPYRKWANPVRINEILAKRAGLRVEPARNKQNQTFRTGNGQILYQTSEIRRFCTEKGEILYGMGMRIGKALWHRRWPYAQASGYSRKRCMELSRAPFALPLLPNSSLHGSKCAQYHITKLLMD